MAAAGSFTRGRLFAFGLGNISVALGQAHFYREGKPALALENVHGPYRVLTVSVC
jgi:hypothetical protein